MGEAKSLGCKAGPDNQQLVPNGLEPKHRSLLLCILNVNSSLIAYRTWSKLLPPLQITKLSQKQILLVHPRYGVLQLTIIFLCCLSSPSLQLRFPLQPRKFKPTIPKRSKPTEEGTEVKAEAAEDDAFKDLIQAVSPSIPC